eukprot:jgi/Mesvir1/13272/Mv18590-RA.1
MSIEARHALLLLVTDKINESLSPFGDSSNLPQLLLLWKWLRRSMGLGVSRGGEGEREEGEDPVVAASSTPSLASSDAADDIDEADAMRVVHPALAGLGAAGLVTGLVAGLTAALGSRNSTSGTGEQQQGSVTDGGGSRQARKDRDVGRPDVEVTEGEHDDDEEDTREAEEWLRRQEEWARSRNTTSSQATGPKKATLSGGAHGGANPTATGGQQQQGSVNNGDSGGQQQQGSVNDVGGSSNSTSGQHPWWTSHASRTAKNPFDVLRKWWKALNGGQTSAQGVGGGYPFATNKTAWDPYLAHEQQMGGHQPSIGGTGFDPHYPPTNGQFSLAGNWSMIG